MDSIESVHRNTALGRSRIRPWHVVFLVLFGVVAIGVILLVSALQPGQMSLTNGRTVVYCAKVHAKATALRVDRTIMQNRLSGLHLNGGRVSIGGSSCISARLPHVKSFRQAASALGARGRLITGDSGTKAAQLHANQQVRLTATGAADVRAHPPVVKIIVPGRAIVAGSATVGTSNGSPVVAYNIKGAPSNEWCIYTTDHKDFLSPIVLDARVVLDLTIQGAICGGETQITGVNLAKAKQIAVYLNFGELPAALHVRSET